MVYNVANKTSVFGGCVHSNIKFSLLNQKQYFRTPVSAPAIISKLSLCFKHIDRYTLVYVDIIYLHTCTSFYTLNSYPLCIRHRCCRSMHIFVNKSKYGQVIYLLSTETAHITTTTTEKPYTQFTASQPFSCQ